MPSETICSKCGASLSEQQEFCHLCGTRKDAAKSANICQKCGAQLKPERKFCPECGQAVKSSPLTSIIDKIKSIALDILSNKKKRNIAISVAALVIVLSVVGGIVTNSLLEAKAEREAQEAAEAAAKAAAQAEETYVERANLFAEKVINAGVVIEDVVDTIQQYWRENIYDDKHGADINAAIGKAKSDKSEEIANSGISKAEIDAIFSFVENVPEEVGEENRLGLICYAVNDLYSVYCDFYDMAVDPSGSYNSYSVSNSETTGKFVDKYQALVEALEAYSQEGSEPESESESDSAVA
ncbi:MAG: zinc ribbon domain-containing protein [Oscillospiraceae bacterium]|nr:zinc ribbon domain-containing protein [Oscillospiraceae bacterium]